MSWCATALRSNLCTNYHLIAQLAKMTSLLNTFSMLIQVCAITWVVYSMCVQYMANFHRNACKLPLYLFVKTRRGTKVVLGTIDMFPLQLLFPSCLNITFWPASHHSWPQQPTSWTSNQNMAQAWVFFWTDYVLLCMQRCTSVFSFLSWQNQPQPVVC